VRGPAGSSARAALRAFEAVGEIEQWIEEQPWEAIPGGWRVRVEQRARHCHDAWGYGPRAGPLR
jgi:hypothetical protein